MQMRNVMSSNIRAVGYDHELRTLAVEFTSGLYHYRDVPPEVDAAIREIEAAGGSVGRFFAAHVRGRFVADKVSAAAA